MSKCQRRPWGRELVCILVLSTSSLEYAVGRWHRTCRGQEWCLSVSRLLGNKGRISRKLMMMLTGKVLAGLSAAQSGTHFCLFFGSLGYSPASQMLWIVGEIGRVEMNISVTTNILKVEGTSSSVQWVPSLSHVGLFAIP